MPKFKVPSLQKDLTFVLIFEKKPEPVAPAQKIK